jgi:hypothetical protein
VFISHELTLPPEIAALSAAFSLSLPDRERLEAMVREEANHWASANPGKQVSASFAASSTMMAQSAVTTWNASREHAINYWKQTARSPASLIPRISPLSADCKT